MKRSTVQFPVGALPSNNSGQAVHTCVGASGLVVSVDSLVD